MTRFALSVVEAAKAAGVGRDTIYAAINSGALKSVKLGSHGSKRPRRLIRPEAIESWLISLEKTGL